MRSLSSYPAHTTNPFLQASEARSATVYNPDAYTLNIIMASSAAALRVLMILAARIKPGTGISEASTKDIRDVLGMKPTNISAAKTELARANLIAYAKARNTYYINPKAFCPITLSFD